MKKIKNLDTHIWNRLVEISEEFSIEWEEKGFSQLSGFFVKDGRKTSYYPFFVFFCENKIELKIMCQGAHFCNFENEKELNELLDFYRTYGN